MTDRTRLALIVASVCMLPGVLAAGQSARISGRVYVSGDTARPVIDAELALLPGFRTVRSDSSGAFRFTDVSRGTYTLRARRVGFDVFMQDVTVDADQERSVRIPMRIGAQVLAEVTIAGRRVMFPARYSEAYARVARGKGTFFTRELIDSLQPWDVKSLLVRVAGVHVNDREVQFARCGSGADVAHAQVYIDGVRQTSYNTILGRDVNDAVRDVVTTSVQLIEVYTSISSVPGEYGDDACAVILIWSK